MCSVTPEFFPPKFLVRVDCPAAGLTHRDSQPLRDTHRQLTQQSTTMPSCAQAPDTPVQEIISEIPAPDRSAYSADSGYSYPSVVKFLRIRGEGVGAALESGGAWVLRH